MTKFDVVVVGGGLAGCAAAIALRRERIKVGLVTGRPAHDWVESLSPVAVQMLALCGVTVGDSPSVIAACWGSDRPRSADVTGARVVRRAELHARMEACAQRIGVYVLPAARSVEIAFASAGSVTVVGRACANPSAARQRVGAERVVDASGRSAIVASQLGAKRRRYEDLASAVATGPSIGVSGVWVEAVAEGWWSLTACRTAATLCFHGRRAVVKRVAREPVGMFAQTSFIKRLIVPSQGRWTARESASARLTPMSGERWLAVGDAASTFQPLASAGVAKALWDGFRAPEALRDRREYEKDQRALFHTYMRQIQQHYALETRWPESDFWTSMATALRRPGSSEALATD